MFIAPNKQKKCSITDTVLMVRPVDFCLVPEIAAQNPFQKTLNIPSAEIKERALKEFDAMVEKLTNSGVNVIVFDKSQYGDLAGVHAPNAVFPNNWLSTEPFDLVYSFPLYDANKRTEKKAFPKIQKMLIDKGYSIKGVIQVDSEYNSDPADLTESAGSLVIDRSSETVYAYRSSRTSDKIFKAFLEVSGYNGVLFNSRSKERSRFNHTNMMMSVGQNFATVCLEAVHPEQRMALLSRLENTGKEVIPLSLDQVEKYGCGNILELKSEHGGSVIVMSERAFNALSQDQREKLKKHGKIVQSNIDTIEEYGGASARSMMCEIFLDNKFKNTHSQKVISI